MMDTRTPALVETLEQIAVWAVNGMGASVPMKVSEQRALLELLRLIHKEATAALAKNGG